ncbi:MAG: flagellar biosynthetic protein FliR, partial [Deltaproteobacteria bacterium]
MTLTDLTNGSLVTAILIFVRVAAVFSMAPVIGERMIPQRVKLAATLGVTVLLVPLFGPVKVDAFPAAILHEASTGLLFGVIFRMLSVAIQMAGVIIAQSGSLAQMFPGMVEDSSPALGSLVNTLALAVAAGLGIQFVFVEVIVRLFEVFPIGQGVLAAWSAETMVSSVTRATVLAFQLAAGFVLASLFYNLVLGFANRVMPQLMLTMIGAPAISFGTFGLLIVTFDEAGTSDATA